MRKNPLFTLQWLVACLAIALATAACIWLGLWQYHRFERAEARAAVIRSNYDSAPVDLQTIEPTPGTKLTSSNDYKVVTLEGSYCLEPRCDLYVRNRTLNSAVGFWQLVPFTATNGTTYMVVRGWVPVADSQSVPQTHPALPGGKITLIARVRPSEPQLKEKGFVEGQLQSVNAAEVARQIPSSDTVQPAIYLVAKQEQLEDSSTTALPQTLEKPSTSLGPHLSYAFQWWIFSIFFPLGLIVTARRRLKDARAAQMSPTPAAPIDASTPEDPKPAAAERQRASALNRYGKAAPASRKKVAKRTDDDEEDSFLDERNL